MEPLTQSVVEKRSPGRCWVAADWPPPGSVCKPLIHQVTQTDTNGRARVPEELREHVHLWCDSTAGNVTVLLYPSLNCLNFLRKTFFFFFWLGLFFHFLKFYGSRVDLQCCDNFCYTTKWLGSTYTAHSFSDSFPTQIIPEYWVVFCAKERVPTGWLTIPYIALWKK